MLRYILAFLFCFLLAGGASAAAIAAGAPAPAKIVFLACLGLFVAAIVDSVVRHPRRHSPVVSTGDAITRRAALLAASRRSIEQGD
jgi:uncharacterized membrane protein YtjA (UPF0391 family)